MGLALWLIAFGCYLAVAGIPYTTDIVLLWLFTLLVALSLNDIRRSGPRAVRDWLPLFGALVVYNWMRGYATTTHWFPHFQPQLDADTWLGFGRTWTVRLQQWLWNPRHLHVWDYLTFVVYLSHFVVPFVVAAVLWKLNYRRFCRFMWMYLTLTFAGFVTFVLYPAQPPWMVASSGRLPHLTRIVPVVLDHVHLNLAAAIILKGSAYANPVASMPSLHAAYPLLITLVFWKTSARWVRVILVVYLVGMAFALVYSAEHFVIDILIGYVYTVVVYLLLEQVFDWWQSRESVPVAAAAPPFPAVPIGARRSVRVETGTGWQTGATTIPGEAP